MTSNEARALAAINRYQASTRADQLEWFAKDAAKRGDTAELLRCTAEAQLLRALL